MFFPHRELSHPSGSVLFHSAKTLSDSCKEPSPDWARRKDARGRPLKLTPLSDRHANVSTTATYYIKTAAADVRNAMVKLEERIAEVGRVQSDANETVDTKSAAEPLTVQ
jgi:hypothetical protein